MAFELVSELEELDITVTKYILSQKKNLSLIEKDSNLIERIRAAI
jgi:hypothetical protein